MFFSSSTTAPGTAPMIYRVDGHEFVSDPDAPRVSCRKCGQDSTEAFLSLAVAMGRQGLYAECQGRSIAFEPQAFKELCPDCGRELSRNYLDLYFGRDASLKDLCRDCREVRSKSDVRFYSLAES